MEVGIVAAIAAVVGVVVGGVVGRALKRIPDVPDLRPEISSLARELEQGRVSSEGGPAEIDTLRRAIAEWAPRGAEREAAFRTALRRMHTFLDGSVDAPLRRGLDGRRPLPVAVREARAAIQDLEFFLADPSGATERENLTDLVRRTAKDFTDQWDTSLRIGAPSAPVHVMAADADVMDALYLVLHNAAQFSGGKAVTVEVMEKDGWGRILVRDEGPGFSAEALSRAYDPFYSTTKGGLGLGLSHARRAVEAQGGRIHLRNLDGGGAEVELALPAVQ